PARLAGVAGAEERRHDPRGPDLVGGPVLAAPVDPPEQHPPGPPDAPPGVRKGPQRRWRPGVQPLAPVLEAGVPELLARKRRLARHPAARPVEARPRAGPG